jgi:hypothetical protein
MAGAWVFSLSNEKDEKMFWRYDCKTSAAVLEREEKLVFVIVFVGTTRWIPSIARCSEGL